MNPLYILPFLFIHRTVAAPAAIGKYWAQPAGLSEFDCNCYIPPFQCETRDVYNQPFDDDDRIFSRVNRAEKRSLSLRITTASRDEDTIDTDLDAVNGSAPQAPEGKRIQKQLAATTAAAATATAVPTTISQTVTIFTTVPGKTVHTTTTYVAVPTTDPVPAADPVEEAALLAQQEISLADAVLALQQANAVAIPSQKRLQRHFAPQHNATPGYLRQRRDMAPRTPYPWESDPSSTGKNWVDVYPAAARAEAKAVSEAPRRSPTPATATPATATAAPPQTSQIEQPAPVNSDAPVPEAQESVEKKPAGQRKPAGQKQPTSDAPYSQRMAGSALGRTHPKSPPRPIRKAAPPPSSGALKPIGNHWRFANDNQPMKYAANMLNLVPGGANIKSAARENGPSLVDFAAGRFPTSDDP